MKSPIIATVPLQMQWPTLDPFLFCAHHNDDYPAGDADMAPSVGLESRPLGSDFSGKNGYSMYHGRTVPGFPQHPHRGFETVTIARKGLIDHADSMGATARFGGGDVQWMTAGSGIVHSEMFPLVNDLKGNPTELFQVWLNLPRDHKMVPAYFTMFWDEQIPRLREQGVELAMYVGALGEQKPPAPPPNSWASQAESDLAIWTLTLQPGVSWTLPIGKGGVHRVLYFFEGEDAQIAGMDLSAGHGVQLDPTQAVALRAGSAPAQFLLLQGRPIGEPVVQHGPFVMNTKAEIQQTMQEYRQTRFGGWPWPQDDPTHAREQGRFAIHADGRREEPPKG
jgi:redox-sensitive bicupin YhaK (pirin superfamily)